jgi:uncharacterized protein YbcV (DUF1398 family)
MSGEQKGDSEMEEAWATARECSTLSGEGRITFPEVLRRLQSVGVERYHADLCRGETTYYLPGGDSHVERLAHPSVTAARDFSAAAVEAAVRAAQRGEVAYQQFLERILAAGCVGYYVYLEGRCVDYVGRNGEAHREVFPPRP